MTEIIPTRGVALALAEEKRFLEAGYEFLDEKRMLQASALFAELELWRAAHRRFEAALEAAREAMMAAIARHGVDNLQDYPTDPVDIAGLDFDSRNFLGLLLLLVPDFTWPNPPPVETEDASDAAEACRATFAALVPLAVTVAVHTQNIHRLIREYKATERRSRALENVILPETTANLATVTDALLDSEQEEALRIRNSRR